MPCQVALKENHEGFGDKTEGFPRVSGKNSASKSNEEKKNQMKKAVTDDISTHFYQRPDSTTGVVSKTTPRHSGGSQFQIVWTQICNKRTLSPSARDLEIFPRDF